MKCLYPVMLLLLFPFCLDAQEVPFWDESSAILDYSVRIEKPEVLSFMGADGNIYIRTLVKAPDYNSLYPYYLGEYDSLICNSRGLVVKQFKNPEYSSYLTKYAYEYDDSGRIASRIWQKREDGTWYIRERETYTYNSCGEMILRTWENYENGSWNEGIRMTYIYDKQGKRIEDHMLFKSNGSSIYDGENITFTTYNDKGGFLTTESGNKKDGVWAPSRIISRLYDNNFYLLEYKEEDNYSQTGWSIKYRFIYTRDSLGRPLTCVYYGNIQTAGSYTKQDSCALVYDNNNHIIESEKYDFLYSVRTHKAYAYTEDGRPLTVIVQESGRSFDKKTKTAYVYSADGKVLCKETNTWDDEFSIWKGKTKIEYLYNNIGLLIKAEVWNADGDGWVPAQYASSIEISGDRTYESVYVEFGYTALEDLTGDNTILDNYQLSQNYPNPFNPETKISFSLPQSGKTMLKVYDMLGREVAELVNAEMEKGPHSVSFNGRSLSSGVYIYRLQSGSFTESKKMMLIK